MKPQKFKALIKDIDNQINNVKESKKTTNEDKQFLQSEKDLANKILNILDNLDLISIQKSKSKSIKYNESIREKYQKSAKDDKFDEIINKEYKTRP